MNEVNTYIFNAAIEELPCALKIGRLVLNHTQFGRFINGCQGGSFGVPGKLSDKKEKQRINL